MDNTKEYGHDLTRMAALSDGVFAIAMTLLVIDIKAPMRETISDEAMLSHFLIDQYPRVVAFGISFVVIGVYWITHHRYVKALQSYDLGLLWWNLIFLFLIAIHPYPSSVVGTFGDMRPAWILYALSLASMGLALTAMWRHAKHNHLLRKDVQKRYLDYVGRRSAVVTCFFLFSAAIGVWNVTAAQLSMILIPIAIGILKRSVWRSEDTSKPAID